MNLATFVKLLALALLGVESAVGAGFSFAHPGLLQSREDLARIKSAVAARQEPIFSGYELFRAHPASQAAYAIKGPGEEIGRSPSVNFAQYDSDANASYQCALMWCITGDRAYAEKAKSIVNAWAATLRRVSGADAVLMAGLGPFKMVNAAELLRSTDAGWSAVDVQQAERMFREAIYPTLENFALFANGNWDTAAIKTVMAIGVFCNDRAMFERALRYYVNGAGDGRLTHYIINVDGQCQESGRDMSHTQLGLAHLGDCCEIAWHQGLDLYGYADNRLLRGFEYTAKYNLGEDVPFTETLDRTGKYHHSVISVAGRGNLRAVFEEIYHHYVNRRGLAAPYTQKAAEKIRPEGSGVPGADHPGFGTLLFTCSPAEASADRVVAAPSAPGAIVARGSPIGNQLTWVAAVGASGYTVKRAAAGSDRFEIIARNLAATSYTDANTIAGTVSSYVVSASNARGESPDAFPTRISAGLPGAWSSSDVGAVKIAGGTGYDGETFTLEGAGADIGGTSDELQFAHAPVSGDGTIVARFVPQVSSQSSKFGVMMRDSTTADAASVALVFVPDPSRERERPGWSAQLLVRITAGAGATVAAVGGLLPAPTVTYGRMMQPCWLRLERHGNLFAGSISTDGLNWSPVGTTELPLKTEIRAGLAACSRLTTVTTTVKFDHVSVLSVHK